PRARVPRGDPVAQRVQGERPVEPGGGHHEGDHPLAPLLVVHTEHLDIVDGHVAAQSSRHGGGRDVGAAADHHVVETTQHLHDTVVDPADVGGEEPAVDQHLGGELGVAAVAVEEGRATDPDPLVRIDLHPYAVQWPSVVDAAATGL